MRDQYRIRTVEFAMNISMLDIGPQTTKLSECRHALMLGVHTADNRIQDFLKFACAILRVKSGVLFFEHEPYCWHFSAHGLKAVRFNSDIELSAYFQQNMALQQGHEHFSDLSNVIRQLGFDHQRLIAFPLKNKDQSIGQLLLYDEHEYVFSKEAIHNVQDLIKNLIYMLQLRYENAVLHEEYEQQVSLSFSKNKYLQIISHDLRAPFHGLLGFTDVLLYERDGLTEAQIQEILSYLNDTLQSTYDLLESVLKWSMADGGRFVYHPIKFKLKEASKIVCSVLSGLAKKKNIQIVNEIADDIEIYADIHMITSVIQNLVSNALKFSLPDRQKKVVLRCKLKGNMAHIAIQDNGIGMSQSHIDKIFVPDLKESFLGTSGEVGAGLGLMLCKRFVDLNAGSIQIVSEESKGTTFTVILPTSLNHQEAEKQSLNCAEK